MSPDIFLVTFAILNWHDWFKPTVISLHNNIGIEPKEPRGKSHAPHRRRVGRRVRRVRR